MTPEEIRQIIREELIDIIKNDRYVFDKKIQILDSRNVQLGKGTGTMLGTETTQKIGFLGKTPVVRQATINDPSGGGLNSGDAVDQSARTAINALIDTLQIFGFIA